MKTLQIHIGELNPVNKKSIQSKNSVYSDLEHIFININNYFDLLLEMCRELKININNFTIKRITGCVKISDYLRFWVLANCQDVLYIDTDVECIARFVPEKFDKPYFVKSDIWCMYNGVYTDFFYQQLQTANNSEKLGRLCPPPWHYNLIEDKYFKHHNLRSWEMADYNFALPNVTREKFNFCKKV